MKQHLVDLATRVRDRAATLARAYPLPAAVVGVAAAIALYSLLALAIAGPTEEDPDDVDYFTGQTNGCVDAYLDRPVDQRAISSIDEWCDTYYRGANAFAP